MTILISLQILLFCLPCIVFSNECGEKFHSAGIVPKIIAHVPEESLKINFEGHEVVCGEEIPKPLTVNPPSLNFAADESSLYTLIMIDPDIPTPQNPTLSNYRHWIVGNIPGNRVQNGDTISEYVKPQPPKGSDPHRYILLVYKQTQPESKEALTDDNTSFNLDEYVSKHNIKYPMAGSFFYVQY